jgi:hypothetical protein
MKKSLSSATTDDNQNARELSISLIKYQPHRLHITVAPTDSDYFKPATR